MRGSISLHGGDFAWVIFSVSHYSTEHKDRDKKTSSEDPSSEVAIQDRLGSLAGRCRTYPERAEGKTP